MDGLPIYPVTIASRSDAVKVLNLVDAHVGSRECDYVALRRDVELVRRTPHCYAALVGDVGQFIGPMDPRFDGTGTDPDALEEIDNLWEWQATRAGDILRPIGKRILVASPGNHDENIRKRHLFNVCREVSNKAGIPARRQTDSWLNAVPLRIQRKGSSSRYMVSILAHHGYRTGRSAGAAANALEDFMKQDPHHDVYFLGHIHRCQPIELIDHRWNGDFTSLRPHKRVGIVSAPYEYSRGKGTAPYAERKMFPATSIGAMGVQVRIKTQNHRGDPRQTTESLEITPWYPSAEPCFEECEAVAIEQENESWERHEKERAVKAKKLRGRSG